MSAVTTSTRGSEDGKARRVAVSHTRRKRAPPIAEAGSEQAVIGPEGRRRAWGRQADEADGPTTATTAPVAIEEARYRRRSARGTSTPSAAAVSSPADKEVHVAAPA
jgi:hypothetical protein